MSVVQTDVTRGANRVVDCAACALEAASKAKQRGLRDDVLPWAIALTVGVVATCVGADADRWFGIGVIAGVLAGGGCAWFSVRESMQRNAMAHEHSVSALEVEANERVASVVRQYEWAVNDITRLKREADRAGATAAMLVQRGHERDARIRQLEEQLAQTREQVAINVAPLRRIERSEFDVDAEPVAAVPFRWALHNDGYGVNLELEAGSGHSPTRVRVVDDDGNIVMTSGTPMYNDDGTPGFSLYRPPVQLIVDLDTGAAPAYRLEALVDLEWIPVEMQDTGRRTKSGWDKRGQMYRVNAEDVYVSVKAS